MSFVVLIIRKLDPILDGWSKIEVITQALGTILFPYILYITPWKTTQPETNGCSNMAVCCWLGLVSQVPMTCRDATNSESSEEKKKTVSQVGGMARVLVKK